MGDAKFSTRFLGYRVCDDEAYGWECCRIDDGGRDGSDETAVGGGVKKRGVARWWWTTYPDGKVESQPNTSEISGREWKSLLRQQVFG